MERRLLGSRGPEVSALGLGCMGMSEFYGAADDAESRALLWSALEAGVSFFDTADCYGAGHNEALLGSVLKAWSGEVLVATKFGIVRESGGYERRIDNSPAYIRRSLEASLRRLGRERVDLYYVHRLEPGRPVEETMDCLGDLVKEGKIAHIGLSEASASTIERAHAVHPLTAVQSEYSLFTRGLEGEVLPTLRRLGIALVPYSPLGRGFLTGRLAPTTLQQPGDFRAMLPRMQGENYANNRRLVDALEKLAVEAELSAATLALAWILAQYEWAVPIPGTRRLTRLRENLAAAERVLDPELLTRLDALFPPGAVWGERYPASGMVGIEA